MNVKVKVGSEVIYDSSKKKVAKVIEPAPIEEPSTMKVNIQKPKAGRRIEVKEDSIQKPKDAIFHKEENNEEVVQESFDLDEITEEPKEEEPIVENIEESVEEDIQKQEEVPSIMKTPLTKRLEEMDDELDRLEQEIDELFDEEDEEEYDQFLSNRQRSQDRKERKQKKANDFSGF